MPVLIIQSREREDGYTAVTLSQDGLRFEVLVTTELARSDRAYNLYQVMADNACAKHREAQQLAQLKWGE